jgi:hypothetical protein
MLVTKRSQHVQHRVDPLMRHQSGDRQKPAAFFEPVTSPHGGRVHAGPEVIRVGTQG